jgi:hypothetical protein
MPKFGVLLTSYFWPSQARLWAQDGQKLLVFGLPKFNYELGMAKNKMFLVLQTLTPKFGVPKASCSRSSQACPWDQEGWKQETLETPNFNAKVWNFEIFLFLAFQSSTMSSRWPREKCFQCSKLCRQNLECKKLLALGLPKLIHKIRKANSKKLLAFQTSMPNFGAPKTLKNL